MSRWPGWPWICQSEAFVYKVDFKFPMVRDFNIVLIKEFFQAFANDCACCASIWNTVKSRTTSQKPFSRASPVRWIWLQWLIRASEIIALDQGNAFKIKKTLLFE